MASIITIVDIFSYNNYFFNSQIQKLVIMYTPSSGFEERVPIAIIRYIAKKNQSSKTDPTKLMVDVSYQFPVTFPFSYADVSYNDMKIPKRFKHFIKI